MSLFVSFRFLPGKKMGGKEQDVDQFLTALCSVCPENDGTKTGQKSDLSNQRAVCPDAPFRSRLHPSLTKVILCPFSCKRTSSFSPNPSLKSFRPARPEYREIARFRVLRHLGLKKVEIFSKNFRPSFDVQWCRSLQGSLVHSGCPSFADSFALVNHRDCTFHIPGSS